MLLAHEKSKRRNQNKINFIIIELNFKHNKNPFEKQKANRMVGLSIKYFAYWFPNINGMPSLPEPITMTLLLLDLLNSIVA